MAAPPRTLAEHTASRRMKRYELIILGIGLCIMILLTLLSAAGGAGTGDAASYPVRGVIAAGVSVHSGGWSGIPSSCTWDPLDTSAALDRFDRGEPIERSVGGIRYRPYVRTCESFDEVDWIPERSPAALALDGRLSLMLRVPTPEIDSARRAVMSPSRLACGSGPNAVRPEVGDCVGARSRRCGVVLR